MGARAKACSLLIHADACLTLIDGLDADQQYEDEEQDDLNAD
jgi:hypothetical protein